MSSDSSQLDLNHDLDTNLWPYGRDADCVLTVFRDNDRSKLITRVNSSVLSVEWGSRIINVDDLE